jgi:hypothetical protein
MSIFKKFIPGALIALSLTSCNDMAQEQEFNYVVDRFADIEVLREAPPKMMVLSTVPDHAVESHERAFRGGKESGLGAMRRSLADLVEEKGYTSLAEYVLCDGYIVTVWVLP